MGPSTPWHSLLMLQYIILSVVHHIDDLTTDSVSFAVQVHLLAKHISKSDDEIERAITRPTYFNPYEAVDFGIIDKVRKVCIALPAIHDDAVACTSC